MTSDEEHLFQKFFPKITEVTSVEAARSWGEGAEIISLDGKRCGVNAFLLQLADDSQTIGPFVLNSVCARALCRRLIDEGFGPESGPHPDKA